MMNLASREVSEIVSGILTLAARKEERIPVARIHSILFEMKAREPVLAGLHFSLTGAVFYSRSIDQAIRNLIDWGVLKLVDPATVAVERIRLFRTHISRTLTNSQFQAVRAASLRYYDRLRSESVQGTGKKRMSHHGNVEAAGFDGRMEKAVE